MVGRIWSDGLGWVGGFLGCPSLIAFLVVWLARWVSGWVTGLMGGWVVASGVHILPNKHRLEPPLLPYLLSSFLSVLHLCR